MDKFNTHGGYFAPQGLLKINEGGKHDENPNGGVQLGVDQQGIPNLVEEGEVVYKDFVYSDNIKAKKDILEQFNIPSKFADKLYSDIANAYCDDAEEQTDPITINGLNVMLGRLAEAQEEQKRQEEEAALMEELKNMSPKELDALEQAMMQEVAAQEEQVIPEEQIQPEVAPGVVAPEQVAPEMPMMAEGGLLNQFDGGGRAGHPVRKALDRFFNGPDFVAPNGEVYEPNAGMGILGFVEGPGLLQLEGRLAGRTPKIAKNVVARGEELIQNAKEASEGLKEAKAASSAARNARVAAKSAAQASRADYINAAKQIRDIKDEANAANAAADLAVLRAEHAANFADLNAARKTAAPAFWQSVGKHVEHPFRALDGLIGKGIVAHPRIATGVAYGVPVASAVAAGIGGINEASHNSKEQDALEASYADSPFKALGGNLFYPGGKVYINPKTGKIVGNGTRRAQKSNYGKLTGTDTSAYYFGSTPRISATGILNRDNPLTFGDNALNMAYQNFMGHGDVYGYGNGAIYFPDGDIDSEPQEETSTGARRTVPATPNIPVTLSDEELDAIINNPVEVQNPNGTYVGHGMYMPDALVNAANGVVPVSDTEINVPELSKGLLRKAKRQGIRKNLGDFDTRLLSPLMDAAMGLANLATPADHYDFKPIRPYLPYGRIRQQYEQYNPIDQNLVANQMRAQANANMRALRNAGLGPSLGANLLAADYAANQNLGNALTNVWDANNQRYNQVIQQNNAADAAIANYDWQVEAARANALNQFLPYNQRMALTVDQMNNEAEQDKYNAVAASLNSTKKFLNDYGWERMNRNMVNSNRANMGYMIDEANRVYYDPSTGQYYRYACGGTLLKNHKK